MRGKMSLLGLAATLGLVALPMQPATADGLKDGGKPRLVRKYADAHARYEHIPDPYAYRYQPRGYYPYYNSNYWSPSREVRARNYAHYHYDIDVRPPYFKSWGHPRKYWHNRDWHAHHHGYIRRNHW